MYRPYPHGDWPRDYERYPWDPWMEQRERDNTRLRLAYCEHAWLLRAEGLTLREIGQRFGVSRERARQMVWRFGYRVQKATRRSRFTVTMRLTRWSM